MQRCARLGDSSREARLNRVTLAIPSFRECQTRLRQGGLYWLTIDREDDARRLIRQVLAGLPAQMPASLLCCGIEPQELADGLDKQTGPDELALFDVSRSRLRAVLDHLPSELTRAGIGAAGGLLLLALPIEGWLDYDSRQLHAWCRWMRDWLARRRCTLLLVCHGEASQVYRELASANELLSGLARLYRGEGAIRYLLDFWHSEVGVCAEQAFELVVDGEGFRRVTEAQVQPQVVVVDDDDLVLAQREVLGSASASSGRWQFFASRAELLQRAVGARAASVLMAIDDIREVDEIAQQVHMLRQRSGNALKIVLREMVSGVRYRDERLLLSSGATLVVPHGMPLPGFLSLLESVQGQIWRRALATDFDSLLDRLRPPQLRGLLAPRDFLAALEMIHAGEFGELVHQLLRLRPHPGLRIAQCLSQIRLRRFGDIACVVDGALYLFLFACRDDGLEPAMANICRLPWRELFEGCERLDSIATLRHDAFVDTAAPMAAVAEADEAMEPAAVGRAPLQLRPATLHLAERCT